MKKQNIEVEGGELLIQSKEGHYAIIPAKDRVEVLGMIEDGCDDCINDYIRFLPREADYAEDGSLIINEEKKINSPEHDRMSKVLTEKNKHLNFVQRALDMEAQWALGMDNYPRIENEDGSHSTHLMTTEMLEDGSWAVYPTIIQKENGELEQLSDDDAYNYAIETNQYVAVPNKELAIYYSENGLINHINN